jgi:hypothetical protein
VEAQGRGAKKDVDGSIKVFSFGSGMELLRLAASKTEIVRLSDKTLTGASEWKRN